jgi:hypothetical protein
VCFMEKFFRIVCTVYLRESCMLCDDVRYFTGGNHELALYMRGKIYILEDFFFRGKIALGFSSRSCHKET